MSLTTKDKEEIALLIRETSELAINEAFKILGLDVTDFEHIERFRDNQTWVKKYRKASEAVGSRILVTITTICTGGVLTAIWFYFKSSGN